MANSNGTHGVVSGTGVKPKPQPSTSDKVIRTIAPNSQQGVRPAPSTAHRSSQPMPTRK